MANRNFNRRQALEHEVKDLYLEVSIGAAGAPTIVRAIGAASIARNGAGDYSITMQDRYMAVRYMDVIVKSSTAADLNAQYHSDDINGAKTVRFLTLAGATPTDPANGAVLLIKLELKNSSVI